MFYGCSSLQDINLNNLNFDKYNMFEMFHGCSENLKNKVKKQFKNLNEDFFNN